MPLHTVSLKQQLFFLADSRCGRDNGKNIENLDYCRYYFITEILQNLPVYFSSIWQNRLEKIIIDNQIVGGIDRGAWRLDKCVTNVGGKIYTTAMAILSLASIHKKSLL